MSDEHKQYASTAAATLEAHILSVHSAKNEAEWWANREILRLREELEKTKRFYIEAGFELRQLREENERLRKENEKLRAELRDADEMLLKQARTIRDYQDEAAALKETGDE